MKMSIKIFILTLFLTLAASLSIIGFFGRDKEVLSIAFEATPTLFLTPALTSIPTLTPKPTIIPTSAPTFPPTPIPTPTLVPQPAYSAEEIHGFIERFSAQYGVDANIMRHIAVCESGFNPLAVNGPYAGLYQFGKTSWITNRIIMGEDSEPSLRYSGEEAAQTAAFMLSIGKGWVWPNCLP